MNVTVAKTAGFCFGVKRAVDKVYEQIESGDGPIYTFGPIIHNDEVVKDFESRGVRVLESEDELKKVSGGTVIIRSHGVPEKIYRLIGERGLNLVDATCPYVKKIHNIVRRESADGKHIIIIGNENHPEVKGITGWASGGCSVIGDEADIRALDIEKSQRICVVAQTTYNHNKFKYLVEILKESGYDINVLDTICSATYERQREAKEISKNADAMIVIGDRNSSNTQKLFEICKNECNETYHIQTFADLKLVGLKSKMNVGITAGASTPNYIIEEVNSYVRIKF